MKAKRYNTNYKNNTINGTTNTNINQNKNNSNNGKTLSQYELKSQSKVLGVFLQLQKFSTIERTDWWTDIHSFSLNVGCSRHVSYGAT